MKTECAMKVKDLAGKAAVITGGGGVLCGVMAKALAAQGVKVAVLDLKAEAAESVVKEIRDAGGTAVAVACNVLERESLEAARDKVVAEFGGVNILINGAGGNSAKATTTRERLARADLDSDDPQLQTFFKLTLEGVRFAFDLNFIGTFLTTQVFALAMLKQDSGVILNISSMNAFCPLTKIPAYSAAKAAISNFTQWLAVHFADVKVRVNALAPGFFLTDQNRFLLTDKETGALTPRGRTIVAHTPMNRFGGPEDLVGTLLWLVSDASAFVTGVVVPVDGGFSAFSGV